ncbi:uncharacterized protein LOC114516566 [Dendronephthya gigantea]|uniref:uncharacterized protein LOC114516566 n=1 Tax=Dendronephthya gigantea TaxID=151771 RepID=UPI00106C75CF|nr:uncharacterized protein LOC114516566 [Dendronephthya gigantea]
MPSSKHIVSVQDQASRFPATKLVATTKAEKVIPALKEMYETYGNQDTQISDNGPPFNSVAMHNFTTERSITQQTAPPLHPSFNPVETFMRPLRKAMKIAREHGKSEKESLENFLKNYRQAPHPATCIPPAAMLFRDGQRLDFPRRTATEDEVKRGREIDLRKKIENKIKVNGSKYTKTSHFKVGDKVLVRNYKKSQKFDTLFLRMPFKIIDMNDEENEIIVYQEDTDLTLCRHPDDIKPYKEQTGNNEENHIPQPTVDKQWPELDEAYEDEDSLCLNRPPPLRRSQRIRKTSQFYE